MTRVVRVLLVAPVHAIGGQAHAARVVAEGFAGNSVIVIRLQARDPALPGPFGILTRTKLMRSAVRPILQLLPNVPRSDLDPVSRGEWPTLTTCPSR